MGQIFVNECEETESQNWFVMDDGRIALEPSDQSTCDLKCRNLKFRCGLSHP